MNGDFEIRNWDYSFARHSAAHRHLVFNVCVCILFIFCNFFRFQVAECGFLAAIAALYRTMSVARSQQVLKQNISFMEAMHKILCIEQYAQNSMHRIICIDQYAQNKMRLILCIENYAQNTMHIILCIEYYAYNTMHTILCIQYYAYTTMHTTVCIQ